jgi:hypothetical protein
MVSSTQSRAIFLIGLFFLIACSATNESQVVPTLVTRIPPPTMTSVPPTPSSPNDSIRWDTLQVTMDHLEITEEYFTDYGSTRIPPAGQKILWVHIRLKNTGQFQMEVPVTEHFSILYAAVEIKPIYGHRQGYIEYATLDPIIFPDQELDAWLRFDIPAAAELNDMRFVFIPESAQVGVSYSSPNYPYAANKPTYVWNCAQ